MNFISYEQNVLLSDIFEKYGEWLEMGYPLEDIMLSLLHKEKVKNSDLLMKIDWISKGKSQ